MLFQCPVETGCFFFYSTSLEPAGGETSTVGDLFGTVTPEQRPRQRSEDVVHNLVMWRAIRHRFIFGQKSEAEIGTIGTKMDEARKRKELMHGETQIFYDSNRFKSEKTAIVRCTNLKTWFSFLFVQPFRSKIFLNKYLKQKILKDLSTDASKILEHHQRYAPSSAQLPWIL